MYVIFNKFKGKQTEQERKTIRWWDIKCTQFKKQKNYDRKINVF